MNNDILTKIFEDVTIKQELPDRTVKYKNGKLHCEDGPAVIHRCGGKEWHINGQLHREDGPAREHSNGGQEYFQNGQRHRLDGPAIWSPYGEEAWFLDGNCIKWNFDIELHQTGELDPKAKYGCFLPFRREDSNNG
jgi:hypothetical protein